MRYATLTLAAFTVWSAALTGCATSKQRSAAAVSCTTNSECATPLVCRLERCRSECSTARDCENGAMCVQDESGLGACQLPAETRCTLQTDCPAPLRCQMGSCLNECVTNADCESEAMCLAGPDGSACVTMAPGPRCSSPSSCAIPLTCGPDGQCREQCQSDRDCFPEQVCLPTTAPNMAVGMSGSCFDQCVTHAECDGTVRAFCGRVRDGEAIVGICFDPIAIPTNADMASGGGYVPFMPASLSQPDAATRLVDSSLAAQDAGLFDASLPPLDAKVPDARAPTDGDVPDAILRDAIADAPRGTASIVASGVVAGARHTCALRDTTPLCWGENLEGRLGVGDMVSRRLATRVALPSPTDWIALGTTHTCFGSNGREIR